MATSKTDAIEKTKRIRQAQQWLLEDYETSDIISNIIEKWGVSDRQAKRYIAWAREAWKQETQEAIEYKRRQKVKTLNKLKRRLANDKTPAGVRAILEVEKQIIRLENLEPAIKIDHRGADGKDLPAATVQTSTVLYMPSNNREAR